MSTPVPNRQLIARIDIGIRRIFITGHSAEAKQWIEEHAPQFGKFFEPIMENEAYQLFVSDGYHMQEVAEYLESFNLTA